VTVDVLVTRSAFGMVEVTLSTTGTDLDGNGYQIAVNRRPGVSGVSYLRGRKHDRYLPRAQVPSGRHLIRLQHVAVNCAGKDLTPRDVDVVSDGTIAVEIHAVCAAATWLAYSALDGAANA